MTPHEQELQKLYQLRKRLKEQDGFFGWPLQKGPKQ